MKGKFETKRKKKSRLMTGVLILAGLVLAAFLALYVMPQVLYRLSGEGNEPAAEQMETPAESSGEILPAENPEETAPEEPSEESDPGVAYPVKLENGKLTLESLFHFEGMNPDCGMETGDNIAAIVLRNTSEDFLAEAKFVLELSDGSSVEFLVTNLPAGKHTMAFAPDNTQLEGDTVCVDASCSAVWSSMAEALPESVSVSVSGTTVTVTNHTGKDIPALTVYCRDPFSEGYFGGKAQEYIINNLSADAAAAVETMNSIMGMTEVVCVAISE